MKVSQVGSSTWNWMFPSKRNSGSVAGAPSCLLMATNSGSICTRMSPPATGCWGQLSWSLSLPNELWGAFNAVSYAIRIKPQGPAATSSAKKAQKWRHKVIALSGVVPDSVALSPRDALDYRPNLTLMEALQCIALSLLPCLGFWWISLREQPPALRPALLVALLFTICLTIARNTFLESKYQSIERPEDELGDPDSHFIALEGIKVHAKCKRASSKSTPPAVAFHCYHGFGANTFSWQGVQQQLADRTQGQVTANDMTGFGLTERPVSVSCYSLGFNGRLGRRVMEYFLAAASDSGNPGSVHQENEALRDDTAAASPRRVLVAHSLGSAAAAVEVINNPQGIDALVFVAPAIVAYRLVSPEAPSSSAGKVAAVAQQLPAVTDEMNVIGSQSSSPSLLQALSSFIRQLLFTAITLLLLLIRPMLVLLLRSFVRNKQFWQQGLTAAWYNKSGVTAKVVDAYRLPQLVIGWEAGLIRFLLARVSVVSPLWRAFSNSRWGTHEGGRSQAQKLADTIKKHDIKVLLLHGESDQLVPVSNSQRLSDILPNCEFVVLPQCGHVPQEECPRKVVDIICKWWNKVAQE